MTGDSRRSTDTPVFNAYSIRIMLGWIASLGLLLVVIHLPFHSSNDRVGWGATSPSEEIAITEVESEESDGEASSPPAVPPPSPTASSRPNAPTDPDASSAGAGTDSQASGPSEETSPSSDLRPLDVLEVSDRTPEIRGGMGSLYLHIEYPPEARDKGIQGRLLLEFTVDKEGQAQSIEVAESLHPLCDSAAVEGIRSVEFVPAKHNGTVVPVRMRLPIRFQLLTDSTGLETATANESPSTP